MMEKNLNALLILIISGVLLSAFGVQFLEHEVPCPLCLLQRLGMIGVAFGCVLNIIFSPQSFHYGISLVAALTGGFVALRQISLHVCPAFPTFGMPVLGLSLYTWSFIVFVCSVAYIAFLLMFRKDQAPSSEKVPLNWFCLFAVILILAIAAGNIFSTFSICGWGPCVGD